MTEFINIKNLHLDRQNPRLTEFGISIKSKEEEILQILWDEMAVNELMYSIVSNGFWDYEPLVVIKDGNGDFITIEGNRRLAAVKLLHDNKLINSSIPQNILSKLTKKTLDQTSELPVVKVDSREDAWKYIGFKHVNGPAKWGSFAKAQYIAEIHNDYGVAIDEIAYQIGDTNKQAQKLYQALMVLEQAEKEKVYSYDDIQDNRIFFSHLYTGLQRDGIQNYIGIKDAEEESLEPVPVENREKLGQLLKWLFGSKKDDFQKIIKSQNPDLKHLDEVLQSVEATAALKAGEPLSYAHELSRPSDSIFEETLLAAKRNLQKARAYISTGYNGEENLMKVSGSIANIADDLYNEMYSINKELNVKKKGNRISE